MKKTIYMFRHGETDWNRDGRMQGGTDIPLNELGRTQALRLKDFFAANPVEAFLSSDLQRAHETAKIASGDLGVPIFLEPRLRETNLGEAEGLTIDEVLARFGPDLLEKWRALHKGHDHIRFPQGESKIEHLDRMMKGLEEFLHSSRAENLSLIGVATHGGSMRRVLHHLHPHFDQPVMVGNCVTYRLEYHLPTRQWTIDPQPVLPPDAIKR